MHNWYRSVLLITKYVRGTDTCTCNVFPKSKEIKFNRKNENTAVLCMLFEPMLHEHVPVSLESLCFERDRNVLILCIESNPDFCSRYESALKETRRIGIRKSFVQGMMIGLIMLFMFGTYALAFWWVCLNDRKLRQPIKFCGIYCFSILKTSNVTPLLDTVTLLTVLTHFYWVKNLVVPSSIVHYIFW